MTGTVIVQLAPVTWRPATVIVLVPAVAVTVPRPIVSAFTVPLADTVAMAGVSAM